MQKQFLRATDKGYYWINIISDATNTNTDATNTNTAGIIVQINALRGSELYPPTIEPLPSIYH